MLIPRHSTTVSITLVNSNKHLNTENHGCIKAYFISFKCKIYKYFLRKIYMEDPNNTNLLGFSNMLRLYGIDTQAGKIPIRKILEMRFFHFSQD